MLGRSQDFGDVIHWPLNFVCFPFFFSFDCENSADDLICSRDVQKKGLFTERSSRNGRSEYMMFKGSQVA